SRKGLGEELVCTPFEQSLHYRVIHVDYVDARGSAFLNVVRRWSGARQGRTGTEGCRNDLQGKSGDRDRRYRGPRVARRQAASAKRCLPVSHGCTTASS